MIMGRFKYIYLVLMFGISLYIPALISCLLYNELSETVFLSSDMSFENTEDDFSTCQNESKVFVAALFFDLSSSWTHFRRRPNLTLSPMTFIAQNKPALRC
jgi:hypothetical protein